MPLNLFSQTIFFILICLTFPVSNLYSQENEDKKEAVLKAIEEQYKGKSFQAQFSQASTLAALEITEKASGKAWFSHPGKMRWLYLSPDRHEIITNGKDLWIFRPEENQVMKGDAASFFKSGAGGAFLSDISLIRKLFLIELENLSQTHATLILKPRNKTPDLTAITIRIARKTNEIQEVVTQNAYEDTTSFKFTNISFTPLADSKFNFIIPEKVSVIEMD